MTILQNMPELCLFSVYVPNTRYGYDMIAESLKQTGAMPAAGGYSFQHFAIINKIPVLFTGQSK